VGQGRHQAIAKSGADAILVPKVESAAQVTHVVSLLDTAGAPPTMAVWAMMETPKGMLRAERSPVPIRGWRCSSWAPTIW
jgi:citrate lyase subunit beta/citryl-CoA lyase